VSLQIILNGYDTMMSQHGDCMPRAVSKVTRLRAALGTPHA
jgi:hypothetical protein